MDRIAELVSKTRDETFIEQLPNGKLVNATSAIFHLGGATLDNEFNHIAQKFCRGLGIVAIENQARICHSSSVPGLGARLGRGAATMYPRDMAQSDCVVIMGSNMAECHPVAFRWPMQRARERREAHPCRSALHAHERELRHPRAHPLGQRHRVSRRHHQPRARERALEQRSVLPELRLALHERRRRSSRRISGTRKISMACSRAEAGQGGCASGRSAAPPAITIQRAGSMRARTRRRPASRPRTRRARAPSDSTRDRSRGPSRRAARACR